ncbi:putative retrotransposon protein [Gregarina niphandrodes]|nr:putative retrotransposon protein [Gregarina niphandrodes]EZG42954.1 putative retrotransposon protein [Gregarina niphandrodes]|eukprot:XP_011134686.1 putative retrotransposon protein [Gregarina niphandrodes]
MEPGLRQELWSHLEEYRDVWEHPKAAQARYEAKFEVTGKPYKARVRHYEPEMRQELETQVKKQLELGVIRPSKSEWAAAPHFVKKKTGEWRCLLERAYRGGV